MVFMGMTGIRARASGVDRALYLPVLAATRQHIFWINKVEDRRPVPQFLRPYIDWRLYGRARRAPDMNDATKRNGHAPRALFKNVNAMTLTHRAVFRDVPRWALQSVWRATGWPCARVYTRGWSAERFGKMYRRVAAQMIRDANERPNYTSSASRT